MVAAATYSALGSTDLIFLAGGGIIGHPSGPKAGVQSLVEAWQAAVAGVPVGRVLDIENPVAETSPKPPGAGSVIVIVATDAPLLPGQCKALARRVPLGLARTGTTGSHFSGDIFLAFSTANAGSMSTGYAARPTEGTLEQLEFLPWAHIDLLYTAVVQCVEEAVVNVLVAAETMVGRNGFTSPALPIEPTLDLLRQSGRL